MRFIVVAVALFTAQPAFGQVQIVSEPRCATCAQTLLVAQPAPMPQEVGPPKLMPVPEGYVKPAPVVAAPGTWAVGYTGQAGESYKARGRVREVFRQRGPIFRGRLRGGSCGPGGCS